MSPKDQDLWIAGEWLWGVGLAVLLPTSTDDRLGAGEWGAGPSAVFLTLQDRWVVGSLFSNVWSFSGDSDVNLFTWQPFVNYNLDDGWYLTSSPIITANALQAVSEPLAWQLHMGIPVAREMSVATLKRSLFGPVRSDWTLPNWLVMSHQAHHDQPSSQDELDDATTPRLVASRCLAR